MSIASITQLMEDERRDLRAGDDRIDAHEFRAEPWTPDAHHEVGSIRHPAYVREPTEHSPRSTDVGAISETVMTGFDASTAVFPDASPTLDAGRTSTETAGLQSELALEESDTRIEPSALPSTIEPEQLREQRLAVQSIPGIEPGSGGETFLAEIDVDATRTQVVRSSGDSVESVRSPGLLPGAEPTHVAPPARVDFVPEPDATNRGARGSVDPTIDPPVEEAPRNDDARDEQPGEPALDRGARLRTETTVHDAGVSAPPVPPRESPRDSATSEPESDSPSFDGSMHIGISDHTPTRAPRIARSRAPSWFGYLAVLPEVQARIRALLASGDATYEEAQDRAIREFLREQGDRLGLDPSRLDAFLSGRGGAC
jgi:hypothetical protein